jgi:predicted GIY-YIG superfamily endonuclease
MKPRGYWTYEKCSEVASKYKTKKDLYTKDKSAYVKITKMRWFELLENLENSSNDLLKRLIYVYEFPDNNCYIGLTFDLKRRNKQHLESEKSQVYKHIKKTGSIPKLIIKSELIDVDLAIIEEERILSFYKKNEWNILNVAKTGSTGGFSKINIKNCIDEIKKYNKLSDFIKKSSNYYHYITRHKLHKNNEIIKELIDNIRTFNERGKFKNKEECENESLKYNSRKDFQLGSKTAWNYSRINGWLDEFFKNK